MTFSFFVFDYLRFQIYVRIQVGKEEVTHSLFADDMILYIENHKEKKKKTTKTPPQDARTHTAIWQQRYKIKAQKSVAFLYANNETEERN